MVKIAHDPDEVIAVVDSDDNIIGETTREYAHRNGILHREVYIYLINSKKEVLLQKRVDDHLWDHSCSGHIPLHQSYLEAALREFEEELGISIRQDDLQQLGLEKILTRKGNKNNNRLAMIYLVRKDIAISQFIVEEGEVESIKYFSPAELCELLNTDRIKGAAKMIISKYILPRIN